MMEGGFRLLGKKLSDSEDKPLVSIVTVTFNSQRYVDQTIRSVLEQTYDNIEYIIIDGLSADNTLDIIKGYENRIAYWRSEKDRGIGDAFNKGIDAASGSIIGIINSDDWYEKNAVGKVVDAFISNKTAGIVCGNVQYWKNEARDFIFTSSPDLLVDEMTINHPGVFVKKEIYRKFGGFDISYKYAMDYELMLRFHQNGVVFMNLHSVISNMRFGGVSDDRWISGILEGRRAKLDYFPSAKVNSYAIKQIIRTFSARTFLYLKLEFIVRFYRKYFAKVKKLK